MTLKKDELKEIVESFAIEGTLNSLEELKVGHIHVTYKSNWTTQNGAQSFVHQRINANVFKDIPGLMLNIRTVINHVQKKLLAGFGEPGEMALEIISARSGSDFAQSRGGDFWRTYRYVVDSQVYNVCDSRELSVVTAKTFGRFQKYLLDLPITSLIDPIPHFMDCERRFLLLEEAIKNDPIDRVKDVNKEIQFAYSLKVLSSLLEDGARQGILPKRITHGDMKLNNILFSAKTNKPLCVVDLDTCMAGSFLFDFGDMVRVAGTTSAEDELDLDKVRIDLSLFEGLVDGYSKSLKGTLNASEIALLHKAPQLLAFTVGVRFLTDYILGDNYFRIQRPQHNLERARSQFALCQSMKSSEDTMAIIVERFFSS